MVNVIQWILSIFMFERSRTQKPMNHRIIFECVINSCWIIYFLSRGLFMDITQYHVYHNLGILKKNENVHSCIDKVFWIFFRSNYWKDMFASLHYYDIWYVKEDILNSIAAFLGFQLCNNNYNPFIFRRHFFHVLTFFCLNMHLFSFHYLSHSAYQMTFILICEILYLLQSE